MYLLAVTGPNERKVDDDHQHDETRGYSNSVLNKSEFETSYTYNRMNHFSLETDAVVS